MAVQVCVVGGGVVGLSVAACLLNTYRESVVVTVMADKYPPNTKASDVAGGAVIPPILGTVDKALVSRVRASIRHYHSLCHSSEPSGVISTSGTYVKPDYAPCKDIWFKDLVSNYNPLKGTDKQTAHFTTFNIDMTEYGPYLINLIKSQGGVFVNKTINSLTELNSFHVIVNCAGLGSRQLACDDTVYGSKGLIVTVDAPWINEFYTEAGNHDGRTYIYPQSSTVALGGRNDANHEDTMIIDEQVQYIIDRCSKVMPSLKMAKIVKVKAGIRPMRKGGVRLERDESMVNGSVVIHNYGHGAEGVMLSWGCAEEVGNIIGQSFGLNKKLYSKL